LKKLSSSIAVIDPVLYQGCGVELRKIDPTMEDSFFIWCLRTSPRGMASSLCQDPIPWEKHLDWLTEFKKRSGQGIYLLCIPKLHGLRIGYGRIERPKHDHLTARISYMISHAAEGKGLGTFLVNRLCGLAKEFRYRHMEAKVGCQNWASIKVLEKNGFTLKYKYMMFEPKFHYLDYVTYGKEIS
jgi:RimJ/RimL family protein N-acetyltransferase